MANSTPNAGSVSSSAEPGPTANSTSTANTALLTPGCSCRPSPPSSAASDVPARTPAPRGCRRGSTSAARSRRGRKMPRSVASSAEGDDPQAGRRGERHGERDGDQHDRRAADRRTPGRRARRRTAARWRGRVGRGARWRGASTAPPCRRRPRRRRSRRPPRRASTARPASTATRTAGTATNAARAALASTIARRRSMRSTRAPMCSAPSSHGAVCTSCTPATSAGERVIADGQQRQRHLEHPIGEVRHPRRRHQRPERPAHRSIVPTTVAVIVRVFPIDWSNLPIRGTVGACMIERVEPTPAQIKAVANSLRLRILRLCNDREWTNKELADRLAARSGDDPPPPPPARRRRADRADRRPPGAERRVREALPVDGAVLGDQLRRRRLRARRGGRADDAAGVPRGARRGRLRLARRAVPLPPATSTTTSCRSSSPGSSTCSTSTG